MYNFRNTHLSNFFLSSRSSQFSSVIFNNLITDRLTERRRNYRDAVVDADKRGIETVSETLSQGLSGRVTCHPGAEKENLRWGPAFLVRGARSFSVGE